MVLEREMRAVAWVITCCIGSAPPPLTCLGVMAEAGLVPVSARRTARAARMRAKATVLPTEYPMHQLLAAADPRCVSSPSADGAS